MTVWRWSARSSAVVMRPDGRIAMPLVEDLMAAGKTPMDLADEIEASLSEYLQDPMVTVTVSSGLGDLRQQIRVVGEAAEPSALAYLSVMTLLDAIIGEIGRAQCRERVCQYV